MRAVKFLILAAFLATLALARKPKWNELEGYNFEKYVSDFGRPYAKGSESWAYREKIFKNRLAIIQAHNADASQTWHRGVNQFTDMSEAEFKRLNGFKKSANRKAPTEVFQALPEDVPLPIEVDYRTWTSPRVLTAVKHQGSCGNCWAFSATETMEAHYALQTGLLPVLAVQQITSCTPTVFGCNGGDATSAWEYVNTTYHGITEEWVYPFSNFFYDYNDPNATTAKCLNVTAMYPNKKPYAWFAELTRVGIAGHGLATANSAAAAKAFLATRGPLSIAVAAGNWQDYENGVFQNTAAAGNQSEWSVDHAVQMVGYGHDGDLNLDYWIVRNSWSTNWGEAGFIRLLRPAVEPCAPVAINGAVTCGTSGCLSDLQFPIVKKDTPTNF